MDDDFMGASVWGTSEPSTSKPPVQAATPPFILPSPIEGPSNDAEFDDFDDFGNPAEAAVPGNDGEDDFGDFGDFDDQVPQSAADFGDVGLGQGEDMQRTASPVAADWDALRFDPMPSRSQLQAQIDEILDPSWEHDDLAGSTTQEDLRQVEGISQILITQESRDMHNTLFQTIPPSKPPNWTRSKIRRQHLISLGIPVNLDQVLPPQPAGKPLPTLHVTTRPMSAPPGPRATPAGRLSAAGTSRMGSPAPSRSGTPKPNGRQSSPAGNKPQLDVSKLDALLTLEADSLTLSPLPTLERHLAELQAQTINTSSMLTYLLQAREALQQDSETYNGLIGELVGEAQKKTITKGKTPVRRGSGMN